MILRRINLENFGRFKGQTFEFRRGVNLVIGPNEAGKTTLAEAVPAVLFGSGRLERFKPWGRSDCSASLLFEGNRRTVEVRRNLVTDEVALVEKDDLYQTLSHFSGKAPVRSRSASCREYRALLEQLLGVADEELFRATYFFGHHPQQWQGDELAQKLRSLVGGSAEADYAELLDELLEEHFSLTRRNPWGRDKQRDREYEQLCREVEEAGEANGSISVEIDANAELAGEIDALAGEIEGQRDELERGRRYIARLQQEREHEDQAASAAEPDRQAEAEPSAGQGGSIEPSGAQQDSDFDFAALGLPESPPAALPRLLEEAAAIRQSLAELQQPYAQLVSRTKAVPTFPWALLGVAVAAVAVAVAAAWWLAFSALWLIVGGVAGAIILTGWGSWALLRRSRALGRCKEEQRRLDIKKAAFLQQQAELSERCEALGLPSSAVDLVRLQKLVAIHREQLDAFWQQRPVETVAASQSAVAAERAATAESAAVMEDDAKAARGASRPGAADDKLAELEQRLAAFSAELDAKQARLASLRSMQAAQKVADGSSVSSDVAALQRCKQQLEARIKVLRKAVDLLAGAVDEFSRSYLVTLNREASRLFARLSAGRYNEVRLDAEMMPQVRIGERRWASAEQFSRGTNDAIYLVLRIALARLRGDGRHLPLMLDDPFVHLDQTRLARALQLVDLASADGQLILFSHNLELGKRAARERWNVVAMDGDSEVEHVEEGAEHAEQLHLL
jgi:uncharacterized protein YhaN